MSAFFPIVALAIEKCIFEKFHTEALYWNWLRAIAPITHYTIHSMYTYNWLDQKQWRNCNNSNENTTHTSKGIYSWLGDNERTRWTNKRRVVNKKLMLHFGHNALTLKRDCHSLANFGLSGARFTEFLQKKLPAVRALPLVKLCKSTARFSSFDCQDFLFVQLSLWLVPEH